MYYYLMIFIAIILCGFLGELLLGGIIIGAGSIISVAVTGTYIIWTVNNTKSK